MYYPLVHIGELLLFINLLLYLRGFSTRGKAFKIFTCNLILVFIVQVISGILKELHIHNLVLSHFYFTGQFIILSFFYHTILNETYQKKVVKIGFFIGLLALTVQYVYDPSLFFKFNLFEIFITSFLLIVYATFNFYNMLNEKKEFYYINMGLLLYLFGSTVLFFVGNLTAKLSVELSYFTWTLNAFLVIVYQLFILMEWYKSFSKKEIQLEI
jgi:hypothetical protein